MIRALIVEDEKPISELIAEMIIEIDPAISIVGICGNIHIARDIIIKEAPDLVFLDIMLPGGTAFDLLKGLDDIGFEIIFITAYSEYIAEAVRFAPNGYIQKPISINDLELAIGHAKRRIRQGLNAKDIVSNMLLTMKKEEKRSRLMIPAMDEYVFIDLDSILRCESSNVYTYIHTVNGQSILSSYTLKQMLAALPADSFFQVHKSHVISLDKVEKYNARDLTITMVDHTQVPVSRNRKDEFLGHFIRISRNADK